ncbi:peptidoglycan-binding protein [Streptomyces sp. NPDC087300]|uniref:peptidoglycan-binding domain-containing protein n=1 Tax=Streptomyces sp. NPDC087300 TaxID=3365780 RepID=UPI003809FC14
MRKTTSRSRRLLRTAVAVTAGAGIALGGLAPLAQATGPHVVDGRGAAYNDWGDEGDLSRWSHADSNATRLWQTVLYADGAKWKDGNGKRHAFTKWDIDGRFGKRTESATRYWQHNEELEDVDGIAGKETFGAADDFLDGPHGGGGWVTYTGYSHDVAFKRLDGTYYVKVGGHWKKASYDWRS